MLPNSAQHACPPCECNSCLQLGDNHVSTVGIFSDYIGAIFWPLLLHLSFVPQSRILTAAFRPYPSILKDAVIGMQLPIVEVCIGSGRFHVASRFSVLDIPIVSCAALELEKSITPSRIATILALFFDSFWSTCQDPLVSPIGE